MQGSDTGSAPLRARFVPSMGELAASAWDALVPGDAPFVRHAFLHALEDSGSVGPGTGWLAHHLCLYRGDALRAAMPLYGKFDSFGEFVFDWSWAEAAEAHGLSYYPKLVAAVPFTPATGPRLLTHRDEPRAPLQEAAHEALEALLASGPFSGLHVLFCSADEQDQWRRHGHIARRQLQFHWQRQAGWHSFADYLAAMRQSARKQVRKERERARQHGLALAMEPAAALSPADIEQVFLLYRTTVADKGAHAYLRPRFFAALNGPLAHLAQVATARDAVGDLQAMALYFRAGAHLYGRYWGAFAALDALHFELCYYLPIEWGLANGIERFEAGAQGEHKLKRGLLPTPCYSTHRLAHAGLHQAVARFCQAESEQVTRQQALLAAHTPFRADRAEASSAGP